MAKKKSEMQAHQERYHTQMCKARSALANGLYREAVAAALFSWDFIDGMMQYERKYEDQEFSSIEAIDLVLRYAPLLLDYKALDELERLLKNNRRIDKNTDENIMNRLKEERERLLDVHRLWNHIERNPGAMQNALRKQLGGTHEQWNAVVSAWEKLGLLCRTPDSGSYRMALATRMSEIVQAKCSSCGVISSAPKAIFLEDTRCLHCSSTVPFVLVTANSLSKKEE